MYIRLIFVPLLLTLVFHAYADLPKELSSAEWQSIRSQIKANQYNPQKNNDGSYQAINHQHGFHIHYDQDGTTTLKPLKSDDYHISMRLYSVAGNTISNRPKSITTDKEKLSYHWSDNVEEFWMNSAEKLEQWFTIQNKPTKKNSTDDLLLALKLASNLKITQTENALNFSGDGKNITYDKFKVWDATGKTITAKMQLHDHLLSLVIQDQAAVYPLTIDPSFAQKAYVKASNTNSGDKFGYALALDGNTLAVGALYGDGDVFNNSGAVYVFTHNNMGDWSQQSHIQASNAENSDVFGWSVALDGDTLVVGAPFESSATIEDENNNDAGWAGAAYVFTRDNMGDWSQQAYIKASNAGAGDWFGWSVAINGDTLAVGAPSEESNSTMINQGLNNNDLEGAGAAYVFVRDENDMWSQQAYIKSSNTEEHADFGHALDLSGDTLVVSTDSQEVVYVFTRDNMGDWSQQFHIKASNSGYLDCFGCSVALSGDTLVVGATGEDSADGDEENNNAEDSGAVYVFVHDGQECHNKPILRQVI